MKILITMGTRPEIIRLYHTIKRLKNTPGVELYLLFTAQNFEVNLTTHIFKDPMFGDTFNSYDSLLLDNHTSFVEQIGPITTGIYDYINSIQPDRVLCLGDTNSGLFTALATKKQGVPLYHMEAGNRCFDPQSPEEVNRRLIDSIADVHLCYTTYAKQNLMAEGVSQNKIHVIGNPIAEFKELHQKGKKEKLILATFHRQENKNNITKIVTALLNYRQEYRVLACLHPRYLDEVKYFPIEVVPSVNFSDFITLEKRAQIIVTDSGTVCEEAAMLHTPSVIIRNTTERPELFDCGSTILSGANSVEDIIRAIDVQLDNTSLEEWDTPKEYKYPQLVSQKVRNILIGKGNYASIAP